jgi:hypothetical protein
MEMKPARRLRPLHWVVIDLFALLIVVGWAMTTYALAVESWKPFGPVTPSYWPILAFPVAVAVICFIAVLLGWQLNAMGLIGTEAVHRPEPRAADVPTPPSTPAAVLVRDQEERAGVPLPRGTGGRKRPFATAGR